MKTIRLLVNVTNFPSQGKLAEDAHQAMLNITIPEALRYSGVRSKVRPLGGSRQLRNVHVLGVHTHIIVQFLCYNFICLSSVCQNSFLCNSLSCHASSVTWIDYLHWLCVQDNDVECSLDETVICDLGNPLKGNENVRLDGCYWIFRSRILTGFLLHSQMRFEIYHCLAFICQVTLALIFETSGINLYTQKIQSQLLLST